MKNFLLNLIFMNEISGQATECSHSLEIASNPIQSKILSIRPRDWLTTNSNESEQQWPQSLFVVKSWRQFFQNKNSDNCPIKKCSLKQVGCKEEFSSRYMQMMEAYPFEIEAYKFDQNWMEKMCVSCTNGQQEIVFDNFSLGQCLHATDQFVSKVSEAGEISYITKTVCLDQNHKNVSGFEEPCVDSDKMTCEDKINIEGLAGS